MVVITFIIFVPKFLFFKLRKYFSQVQRYYAAINLDLNNGNRNPETDL